MARQMVFGCPTQSPHPLVLHRACPSPSGRTLLLLNLGKPQNCCDQQGPAEVALSHHLGEALKCLETSSSSPCSPGLHRRGGRAYSRALHNRSASRSEGLTPAPAASIPADTCKEPAAESSNSHTTTDLTQMGRGRRDGGKR